LPGEQAQADWAHFGQVRIGAATRRLSCFVLTLSYSRALSACACSPGKVERRKKASHLAGRKPATTRRN
jgi:transposase